MKLKSIATLAVAAIATSAQTALAHTGHADTATHATVVAGAAHVLNGLDHLAAAMALGVWAILSSRSARFAAPASFMAAMVAGGLFAYLGGAVAFVEPAILVGTLALIGLAVTRIKTPVWAGALLAGAFGAPHGYAHMAELSATTGAANYALGVIGMTLIVMGAAAAAFAAVSQQMSKNLAR